MLIEEKIHSKIKRSNQILLIAHRKPDGDTLGALGALFFYLKETLKKPVTAFCVDQIPQNLHFLKKELSFSHEMSNAQLASFDLIIALDCGDMNRTGIKEALEKISTKPFIINIDHHHANDNFGNENLVKSLASSTSEIIYDFFKKFSIPLTKKISNFLLTGILTDTTFFSNSATTNEAVLASSELLRQGAELRKINHNLQQNKDIQILKLWGKIFDRLIYNSANQIAIAVITHEDLNQDAKIAETLDGLSNFLTTLYDAKISLVLTQINEDQIKGSLRTNSDEIDISALAKKFGGGGHKKAAGFLINGKIKFNNNFWQIQ